MPSSVPSDHSLLQEFVNTNDLERHQDTLASPAAMRDWLVERGLLGPNQLLNQSDHAALIEVREALRELLLANNGVTVAPEALVTLNRRAQQAPLQAHFHADGTAGFDPADGGAGDAIGRLLAMVVAAMAAGCWPRMKACREPGCEWAFYDSSRNASRTWCNMQSCGNRAKARAFLARHRAVQSPASPTNAAG